MKKVFILMLVFIFASLILSSCTDSIITDNDEFLLQDVNSTLGEDGQIGEEDDDEDL